MKKIIIFGGIGAVVLIAIILVVVLVVLPGGEKEPEPIVYSEFPLGEAYTNIAVKEGETPSRKPILKYSPVIEYPENEETMTALTSKATVIQHEIRKYFMMRNEDQLSRMDAVQEDLTELVIEILEADAETISNVYFVEFIIQ